MDHRNLRCLACDWIIISKIKQYFIQRSLSRRLSTFDLMFSRNGPMITLWNISVYLPNQDTLVAELTSTILFAVVLILLTSPHLIFDLLSYVFYTGFYKNSDVCKCQKQKSMVIYHSAGVAFIVTILLKIGFEFRYGEY